jgi:FdrA protein
MPDCVIVRKDSYHDSVLLMRISRQLRSLPGIDDAAVVMATPQNGSLLAEAGYRSGEMDAAGPNDLVIAVRGGNVDRERIEAAIADLLETGGGAQEVEQRPRSLATALRLAPQANLAIISVPGLYAAREARRALERGLHVLLFSDNVSVEDEVALKVEAVRRGLLMMGPDCGTAIINGKPLALANVIRRGPIGVVGASGTGIQEVTCCIHRMGGGITQAIGTGGRDLSDKVGGIMTLMGIEAFAADPATRVIVVISKPPSLAVAAKVSDALRRTGKPGVVHFVGAGATDSTGSGGVKNDIVYADSLAGAAEAACGLAGVDIPPGLEEPAYEELAGTVAARLRPDAKLRGLFCGGTTGQEALALLTREGFEIRSNLHKSGPWRIEGTQCVSGHAVLDLGDDVFTVGRPHPMIDPALRNERLQREMLDPEVGILLFDCVLGYGSHEDPAGVLAEGVRSAQGIARQRSAEVAVIASITGTDLDPQGYHEQKGELEDAGVFVVDNNRRAVLLAAAVLGETARRGRHPEQP